MDDPALDPEIYDEVLHDLARVNALDVGAPGRRSPSSPRAAEGHAGLPPARRRLRPWRHAAPDRALGAAQRTSRSIWSASISTPNSAAAARAATPTDWPIEYRTGDYRDVAGAGRFRRLERRHPPYERRPAPRLPRASWRSRRRAAGWSTTSIAARFAYYGFPLLCPADGLAPDRARGRPAVDRPRASARPTGGR